MGLKWISLYWKSLQWTLISIQLECFDWQCRPPMLKTCGLECNVQPEYYPRCSQCWFPWKIQARNIYHKQCRKNGLCGLSCNKKEKERSTLFMSPFNLKCTHMSWVSFYGLLFPLQEVGYVELFHSIFLMYIFSQVFIYLWRVGGGVCVCVVVLVRSIDFLCTKHYSFAWLCSISYLTFDMGLHYLTFMRRNLRK